jgi:molecular chaperone IbpA
MEMGKIHFNPLSVRTVGFDKLFDNLDTLLQVDSVVDKYPPHNMISIEPNKYVIELALAGFKEQDIDITIDKGMLTVKSSAKFENESKVQYIHRGIAKRSFTKSFKLADTVVVSGADFKDGILSINLENIIPDEQKPRKIEIGKKSSGKSEFLAD